MAQRPALRGLQDLRLGAPGLLSGAGSWANSPIPSYTLPLENQPRGGEVKRLGYCTGPGLPGLPLRWGAEG